MYNQAYIFFIFILNGFLIGLIFDVFRVLRKSIKTKDVVTYIEDFLFWIISGIIVLYSILKFNNGEIRGFIFIGLILGILFYLLLFSKIFVNINLLIISILKRIINCMLIVPLKKIYKLLKKSIILPFYNYNKKIVKKFKSICNKKHKKQKNKKDFA